MRPRAQLVWDGIVAEARSLLESKRVCATTLQVIARMNPIRQAEAARLMVAAGCYSKPYARALMGATDRSMVIGPRAYAQVLLPSKKRKAANQEITELAEQLDRLSTLSGSDLIGLHVSCRYAESLLANQRIRRYLEKKWPVICEDLVDLLNQTRSPKVAID
jgi:hypothetical protein